MPGERRGGRTHATPNRRTILADRMMVVLAGCSAASPRQRLACLVDDTGLPADIRMAVAQKAFPGRSHRVRPAQVANSELDTMSRTLPRKRSRSASHAHEPGPARAPSSAASPVETMSRAAVDALFGIVSDATAQPKARRKAAVTLAKYFLPTKPVNKRWQFTADKYGFAINAEVARDYRAIDFKLRDLKGHRNRDFPEFAQRIAKLEARKELIRQRLQCPDPHRYGTEQFGEDALQLQKLARKRESGSALTEAEDAEEAHLRARFGYYAEGPEQTARRYLKELEDADLWYRKSRFYRDKLAAPLSRKQHDDLRLLRWLYPPHVSKRLPSAGAELDAELDRSHPFNEEPAFDGNLYPRGSKLRPVTADEVEIIEEFVEVPPYCICISGQPPIFTYDPPTNSSSNKSEAPSAPSATGPNT